MVAQGNKVVWGSGIACTVGIVTASKLHVQSAELTAGGSDFKLRNVDGDTVGRYYFDNEESCTITCIPYDASTQTTAAANFDLPSRGTAVTITATTAYEAAGTPDFASAKWIYTGGTKRLRNDGVAELTMNLVKNESLTPS